MEAKEQYMFTPYNDDDNLTSTLTIIPEDPALQMAVCTLLAKTQNVSQRTRLSHARRFNDEHLKSILNETPVIVAIHESCGVQNVAVHCHIRPNTQIDVVVRFTAPHHKRAYDAAVARLVSRYFTKRAA